MSALGRVTLVTRALRRYANVCASSSPRARLATARVAAKPRATSTARATSSRRMTTNAVAVDAQTTTEPRWDLEKHFGYAGTNDSAIDEAMSAVEKACEGFKATYEGTLDTSLLAAIETYEGIEQTLTTVLSYMSLSADTRLMDDAVQQRKGALMQQYGQASGNYLTWFGLELADMAESALEAQYAKDAKLKNYKPYIDEVRRSAPYNLSKEVERALTVRSSFTGKGKVIEFYGNELSRLQFDLDGKKVNMEVLLAKMTSSKDTMVRRQCMKTLNDGLKDFERICALSLNMAAGSWAIENKERGFKNLRSSRNLSNNLPDDVVDSLLAAVATTGVDYCKKYYTLKKQILKSTQGLETFTWADRNASIDIGSGEDNYSWEQAVELVHKGYNKFSPTMADMFTKFVDEKRIDVPAQDGKRGGAYCSSAYGSGPFQLLNFTHSARDVATLAHESGHAVHFELSYPQGILQFHPPLTLAETASIFGEMIVFRDLLEKTPSDEDRLAMIMSKVDDIINSVVRQCSFDKFEEKVHTMRAKGAVTPEEMSKAWRECTEEYYGKEGEIFDSLEDTSHLYAYVSHFHNVAFYVYAYAFGDLLVGSLYGAYMKQPEGFEAKLLDLLRAGGTKDFVEAVEPFGLDPKSATFWSDALHAHLGGLMAEAEELSKKLGYSS